MNKKIIKVSGMSCGHCSMAVKKSISAVKGVRNVDVDLSSGKVTVEFEGAVADELIAKAVRDAGYEIA